MGECRWLVAVAITIISGVVLAPTANATTKDPIDLYYLKLECAALAFRTKQFNEEDRLLETASKHLDIFLQIIEEGGDTGRMLDAWLTAGRFRKTKDYILGYDYATISAEIDRDVRGDVPSENWLRGQAYFAKAGQLFTSKRCTTIQ